MGCLTVLPGGVSTAEVATAFGTEEPERCASVQDALDNGRSPLAVVEADTFTVTIEFVTAHGARAETLSNLSALAQRAGSISWDANSYTVLGLASRGRVLFRERVLHHPRDVDEQVAPVFAGLDLGDARFWQTNCIIAIERFVGVRLSDHGPLDPRDFYALG